MKDISRQLFLVDGITEVRAFREKFKKDFGFSPALRKVDCNGKSVTPEGYAAKALPMIQLGASGAFDSFLCIVDLETRQSTPDAFGQSLAAALTAGVEEKELAVDICVAVPNRMFENWIVSDIDALKSTSLIEDTAEQEEFDGRSGVSILKKIMAVSYRKTFHGWQLFKKTRFDVSRVHSESFRSFADILEI